MSSIEAIDKHIEDMAEKAEKAAAIEESEAVEAVETTTEAVEEVIERPYTIRKLKNGDLWSVVQILGKLLPDELKKAFVQVVSGEKSIKEVGGMVVCDMAVMITKNAYKAQHEVDAWCADLIGVTVEELNEMEFGTTPLIIVDAYEDAKNTSFFKVLSKLL